MANRQGPGTARTTTRTRSTPARTRRPAGRRAGFGGEDPAVLRKYYRQMALIRAFELRAAEMYTRAKIGGGPPTAGSLPWTRATRAAFAFFIFVAVSGRAGRSAGRRRPHRVGGT
jgi:hypothetical protein